jgi:hypothetical protein
MKTIKIYVEGGAVMQVENLPQDYEYEIIDSDIEEINQLNNESEKQ